MLYQMQVTRGKYPNEWLELRAFATEEEVKQAEKFGVLTQTTIRPNSVYVAAVGCHWSPGAWQKVVDMVHYTNTHNMCCWLAEFPDRCVTMPYDAIGSLRDTACMAALDAGFEWILLIDNDILPEPDLVVKLVEWGMPVVVPLIVDHKLNVTLSGPIYPENRGLRRVKWAVFSCILMRTKVLNCFPSGTLFTNLLVEPEFFEKLNHYGHQAFIDTNTELKMAENPTYSGGLETLDEKWAFYEKADHKRKEKPNRRPMDPTDTREVYLPKILTLQTREGEKDGSDKGTTATENSGIPKDSANAEK